MTLAFPEPASRSLSDAAENRFEFQCRMLEKGFDQVQHQIGRFDDIAFRIKAGSATLWVGLIGWSFTSEKTSLVLLGFVVIPGFWLLEAMFRGIQQRYIAKARELSALLNDQRALDACFARRELPEGMVYPVGLREREWAVLLRFLRCCVSPHVATVYLFLGLANVLVWVATGGTLDLSG